MNISDDSSNERVGTDYNEGEWDYNDGYEEFSNSDTKLSFILLGSILMVLVIAIIILMASSKRSSERYGVEGGNRHVESLKFGAIVGDRRTPSNDDYSKRNKYKLVMTFNDYVHPGDMPNDGFDYNSMYQRAQFEEKDIDWQAQKAAFRNIFGKLLKSPKAAISQSFPTCLMDYRSMLEVLADYITPGLLCSITKGEIPEDRMIRVLRFYIGGFKKLMGNQDYALKPFNPIHGELFRCKWKPRVRGNRAKEADPGRTQSGEYYDDRGLLWANDDEVTFIAEQYSHHPPITTFYAESQLYGIQVSGTFEINHDVSLGFSWNLIKSITVYYRGKIEVKIRDYNETYTMPFPTFQTLNPLGGDKPPAAQLKGSVVVSCKESNYSANVEFIPNNQQVKASVIDLRKGKSTLDIEGRWDNKIYVVNRRGERKKLKFLDLTLYPSEPKICAPIEKQVWLESRRVWRKVVKELMDSNGDLAREEKSKVEERQRKMTKNPFFFEPESVHSRTINCKLKERIQ